MNFADADEGPTQADVGTFIPQGQLEAWWKGMQTKFPQVFTPQESCPSQVAMGTKLRAFFDGDTNQPMHCQVVGSKFKPDIPSGMYAMYVVKINGELAYIHLTEVGEEGGWEVVEA